MRRLWSALAACAAPLAVCSVARADGFGFYAQSACATALGGAFIGRACANDPSTIFYNPAALTLLPGTQLSLGGSLVFNRSDYDYTNPLLARSVNIRGQNETFLVPHVYLSHRVTPRVALGIGFFTPYGLGSQWPTTPDNLGRFVAYNTEMLAFYTQPTAAVRLTPQISLGVGLEIVYTTADLDRLVDLQEVAGPLDPDVYPPGAYSAAEARLSGNGWSTGFVASVLIEPSELVSVGLRYFGQTTARVDGELELVQTPLVDQGAPNADVLDPVVAASLPSEPLPAKTEFTLPDQILAGIEIWPAPRWTLAFAYQWTDWSDFDTFQIVAEGQAPDTLAPSYGDASTFRVGIGYQATPVLALRAGFVYDPTPADPAKPFGVTVLLPDATRNNLSLGLGWQLTSRLRADVYWLGVWFLDTGGCVVPASSSLCGVPAEEYATTAHLFGLTLGHSF